MRLALILLFVFINLSANGMKAHLWLQNFQKVLIETLPVNRVYIIEEQRVFSFEVPKEFMNKSSARNVSLTGSIHIVFVRGFMEGNVIVSRMMVEPREMLPCFARHSECVLS
jgi:capsular polysaccharide biosynthesis protein